jgi:hypothetical protein
MTILVPNSTFECENMNVVCFGDENIYIFVSINIANCWNADSILSFKIVYLAYFAAARLL